MLKTISLIGLLLYFAFLLIAVAKEKRDHSVEDFFLQGGHYLSGPWPLLLLLHGGVLAVLYLPQTLPLRTG